MTITDNGAIDPQKIEQRALSIPEQARELKIIDDGTYQRAGYLLTTIKELRKAIQDHHDPIIDAAHNAHKIAIAQKKKVETPLIEAEGIIKPAMADYDTEQQRKANEELRRLESEARKRAEDEALAAAVHAEKEGDKVTAEAIVNAPIECAPIVKPAAAPKVVGVSYRENWSARLENPMELLREIVAGRQPISILGKIDMMPLNQMARALKGAMNVPGVKPVCEKIVSSRQR